MTYKNMTYKKFSEEKLPQLWQKTIKSPISGANIQAQRRDMYAGHVA